MYYVRSRHGTGSASNSTRRGLLEISQPESKMSSRFSDKAMRGMFDKSSHGFSTSTPVPSPIHKGSPRSSDDSASTSYRSPPEYHHGPFQFGLPGKENEELSSQSSADLTHEVAVLLNRLRTYREKLDKAVQQALHPCDITRSSISLDSLRPPAPRPSFIRPSTAKPRTRKTDPVSLYHKYKQEWERNKIPGTSPHKSLRWEIRHRMAHIR
ncbi:unnamed protein product [Darwinula stevensoni]|uniref:Centriolar and ciliogenesis-associated protein HYLS1 C-terminal domain-containing protein n=1 Tax=Darwinula stevensoni TaxID=69355 RepID=A0A7R9AG29_9CRUS|nr:unnamed protein product [Darwinula stevensoni]CAG0903581.1 unnamed protein product [Darwinula stevensoni]